MERNLSQVFGGRRVDLRAPEDLSPYFRQKVTEEALVEYAQRITQSACDICSMLHARLWASCRDRPRAHMDTDR